MVDTELLDEKIGQSGKKIKYLAEKLGCSPQAFKRKRSNKNEFNSSEVIILCSELNINKPEDKEKIFFARNVEKNLQK